jgi:predicted RNA binding protein YcfA (HicA-like mRNA interferase family)
VRLAWGWGYNKEMASARKLFERLLAGSYNLRFSEFRTLLEAFGFTLDRVRGSHHIYVHVSVRELLTIQPRRDGKAKPYQIRQFLRLVEEYNLPMNGEKG